MPIIISIIIIVIIIDKSTLAALWMRYMWLDFFTITTTIIIKSWLSYYHHYHCHCHRHFNKTNHQLSGCAICGLGLWTLLEKGDFIQLLTNSTYQVKRTMMMIRSKCMMKKEDTENKSNGTNDVTRQQHGFLWRPESFQSSQLYLATLPLPWRVDVSLHRFVMMMAMMMSSLWFHIVYFRCIKNTKIYSYLDDIAV